jgi:hypothetical protein
MSVQSKHWNKGVRERDAIGCSSAPNAFWTLVIRYVQIVHNSTTLHAVGNLESTYSQASQGAEQPFRHLNGPKNTLPRIRLPPCPRSHDLGWSRPTVYNWIWDCLSNHCRQHGIKYATTNILLQKKRHDSKETKTRRGSVGSTNLFGRRRYAGWEIQCGGIYRSYRV